MKRLRKPLSNILPASGLVFCIACASVRTESAQTSEPVNAPGVAAARRLLESGDFEQAQADFTKLSAEWPRDGEAWLGFADASLRLFEQCVANPRRGNALLYLQDAQRGYERAGNADPLLVPAWAGLARTLREQALGVDAARAAQRARDAINKSTPVETKFDVELELGLCRALEYKQSVANGEPPIQQAELYQRAVEALQSAHAIAPGRTEPWVQLAFFEYSRNATAEAMRVLVNAIKERPEEYAYHEYLASIADSAGLIPKLVEWYDGELADTVTKSPTARWYLGSVKLREAAIYRNNKDYNASMKCYAIARDAFMKSRDANPEFGATARREEAATMAGEARVHYEKGKIAEAAGRLTEAFSHDPGVIGHSCIPITGGAVISPKVLSQQIGGRCFDAGEFEQGSVWFERWLEFSPDDVDWLNNAGLMRRDLGEKLSREGQQEKARECFEASYRHYQRVSELSPDEPRLINDTALILLYHLHRDLDKAEAMFRRSIELGEDKLSDLGGSRPEPDEQDPDSKKAVSDWDYYSEATGDACQNLALLLWERQGESKDIRKYAMRALELDPRGSRGWLRDEIQKLPESGPAPKLDRPIR